MKTIPWTHAILAGIAGTVLFDITGLLLGAGWWDIPQLLGEKTGLGTLYGVAGHFGNGMALAVLYAGIAPSLWGPKWLRPLIFITVETIVLVWLFMFPLLGAGVAGLEVGPQMAVGSLLRHLIFAIPLIFVVNKQIFETNSSETS